MSPARAKFGFCVPVFANPGAAFFRTPAWTALEPGVAIEAAVEAERLGYDSLWVADHLFHGDGAILEGWTTLAVLAGRTERVQLGSIHLALPFRAPQIAAKQAATLDALAPGRLVFFYDWGYVDREVSAYGLQLDPPEERAARVDEALRLIDALWRSDDPVTFEGKWFRTEGAVCRPRPAERPPIWLGEVKDDAWLEVVARHADGWNSAPASPAQLAGRIERVRAACRRELVISLEVQVLIAESDAAARETLRAIAALPPSPRIPVNHEAVARIERGEPLGEVFPDWLVGTPDDVRAQISAYRALGVSHFMLWFVDFPSLAGLRLFAQELLP